MPRLNVIGEGPSEESFVRLVVAPFLGVRGVYATARSVETGRRRAFAYRGGMSSYERARGDVIRWLKQDRTTYVTTMFDLYGLPGDFPGFEHPAADAMTRVTRLEEAFRRDIDDGRFIPYIQVHEYEALLFSDVGAVDEELATAPGTSRIDELVAIRAKFASPEHIDDGYDTCPSRRLIRLFPRYQKVTDGLRIAARIGIDKIRADCKHFDAWITSILALPPDVPSHRVVAC